MSEAADGVQSGTDSGLETGAPVTGEGAQSGTEASVQQGVAMSNREGTSESGPSEADRLRDRLRASDQRASKFENELRAIRDKDLPELDRLKRDAEEIQNNNRKLMEDLQKSRIENAFLSDSTHSWHSSAAVLKMIDLEKIEIDSDGNVTGLKEALKMLAHANPWMVKDGGSASAETDAGKAGGSAAGATGLAMTGNAGNASTSPKGLGKRFSMLGTRPTRR